MITIRFLYLTGLKRRLFRNARLAGSWNDWQETPMVEITAGDGCPAFAVSVNFDDSLTGREMRWGVRLDGPGGENVWGINLEVKNGDSSRGDRTFRLPPPGSSAEERYYFTYSRRFGAQKFYPAGQQSPDVKFTVWAPHAQHVEVVFSTTDHGYIADDGAGIDPTKPLIPLTRDPNGIWESAPVSNFSQFVGLPYLFRIRNAQGDTVYRTDIHSRWQIGRGNQNPAKINWDGNPAHLDGSVSCSVVIDQDIVRREFEPTTSPPQQISDDQFWTTEFTPGRPVPHRIEDLVIYELHVGSLGYPHQRPGTLADAMELLNYLSKLGINTVELLPLAEFYGNLGWGYGDTHHFVIESSAGGRDKYKHFVRECHRRGIAVIQDVVYNHFDQEAERAEWNYDSTLPEENMYYWYEGRSSDHPSPDGGYLNNGSSGFTPRLWEESVRQLFISSAAEFIEEFHVDGLRVDLTQALHRDNTQKSNGWPVRSANLFGQKFLREWSRTLRMIRPTTMLIAEDHTGWDAVTKLPDAGGLGFNSTWFAEFYHNLIGDSNMSGGAARLLHEAGFGHDGPLAMEHFSGVLWATQFAKVCYHESHDEAGNAAGSMRTSKVAVNDATLFGATRDYAEARCRVVAALSLLSAGTPMFFMGEEIVAQNLAKFDNILASKEDLYGERQGMGAKMFRYYQDLVHLRLRNEAARARNLDVIHVHGGNRVIAFTRRHGTTDLLVVASLNNHPFDNGYILQTESHRLPDGLWQETFNSDAEIYGGHNIGNYGAAIPCHQGTIELRLPANGVLVLQRR